MKKTLSTVALLAFVFTAGSCFAGSAAVKTDGCPDDCQREIDTLKSSKAQQDEQIKAYKAQIDQQAAEMAADPRPAAVDAAVKARDGQDLAGTETIPGLENYALVVPGRGQHRPQPRLRQLELGELSFEPDGRQRTKHGQRSGEVGGREEDEPGVTGG